MTGIIKNINCRPVNITIIAYLSVVKKVTIVLLTAVYLLTAVGVSASSFYCCGILRSTTVSLGELKSNDSKAVKNTQCCKHTKQTFKVKDTHFASHASSLPDKFFAATLQTAGNFQLAAQPVKIVYLPFNSHAPPLGQRSIYALNCTYRI